MKFLAAIALLFNAMFAVGADMQPSLLRVVIFNGGWDLPIWAAQRQGFFEGNGVTVQLSYTPSSEVLITGLFDGRFDIALATAREGGGTTLITGSFHTVGDAMARLQVSPLAA